jgi:hypothetical protein
VRNTEITNKECLRCIRRPFPIGNVVLFVHIEAKLLRSLISSVVKEGGMMPTNSAEFLQPSLSLVNCLDPLLRLAVPLLERLFERGKPRVERNNACD